jgi:ribosomal protein S18 acetylase RimI-like enzyme
VSRDFSHSNSWRKPIVKLEIRPYREFDEWQVMQLWKEVFAYPEPRNEPRRVICQKVAVDDGLLLVAVADGDLVGTVMGGYDGHRGWIYSLAVAAQWRRRGIGNQLMRHMETLLAQRNCPKINLQLLATNAATVEFYNQLGYRVEERISMGKVIGQPGLAVQRVLQFPS